LRETSANHTPTEMVNKTTPNVCYVGAIVSCGEIDTAEPPEIGEALTTEHFGRFKNVAIGPTTPPSRTAFPIATHDPANSFYHNRRQ
jgi:hypothetical protein